MSEKPIPPKANRPAMDLLACPAMTMATWRTVPTSDAMARARRFSRGAGAEVGGRRVDLPNTNGARRSDAVSVSQGPPTHAVRVMGPASHLAGHISGTPPL